MADVQPLTDKPPPSYSPVYAAALYPELAVIARRHGYALAVHGSLRRDIDLIAVPWVQSPSEPQAVVDAFCAEFWIRQIGAPQEKPHGRRAWTITVGHGECSIDLSFVPSNGEEVMSSRKPEPDFNPHYFGQQTRCDGDLKTATVIKHDLVIGGYVMAPQLIASGWVCQILANSAPPPESPSVRTPLIDGTGNDFESIQRILIRIVRWWNEGRKVAVLCRSGANRAPAISAAAMVLAGRATSVYGAIEHFRAHRREVGHYGGTASEIERALSELVSLRVRDTHLHLVGGTPLKTS